MSKHWQSCKRGQVKKAGMEMWGFALQHFTGVSRTCESQGIFGNTPEHSYSQTKMLHFQSHRSASALVYIIYCILLHNLIE